MLQTVLGQQLLERILTETGEAARIMTGPKRREVLDLVELEAEELEEETKDHTEIRPSLLITTTT